MYLLLRIIVIYLILISNTYSEIIYPFKKENIQSKYTLDDYNMIFIEQFERGDRIWNYNIKTKKFNNISFVWSFISLAKRCEGIKEQNIYFASNLEYYLGGGSKVDNPQIRIFSLNDPSPWRDSDLGIVPNIDWAKQHCEFY
jgi:hypothetical protein|tara:strand:- start:104 stop:529 length:426 start_codon:yes stop_codon:yes gene_type:complete